MTARPSSNQVVAGKKDILDGKAKLKVDAGGAVIRSVHELLAASNSCTVIHGKGIRYIN